VYGFLSHSIVTVVVSCIISEIKREIDVDFAHIALANHAQGHCRSNCSESYVMVNCFSEILLTETQATKNSTFCWLLPGRCYNA